ncbi:MAG TPA: hypothetical protein VNY24_01705 [Candidatus Acidoferrales bacterium]|jgi:hypothetical protein|nr:hypothetical protein [Candidatus Acidoferrales bacterium]
MRGLRAPLATLMTIGLTVAPTWAGPKTASSLGTVVTAEKARVGDSSAEVGTTIFSGDRLSTDREGSVQIRAGAARLLLQSASMATLNDSEGAPSAKLILGTATFSTGNSRAFTLSASRALIRAQSDAPTIGQVTYLNEKELLVVSKRGPLTITVDGETELIADGTAYHVFFDPPPTMAQGPEGAGAHKEDRRRGMSGPPLHAGRNYFLITAVGVTAVVTGLAISEALESPNRP